MYGELTKDAVLRWQTDKSIPGANGVFGPASQAAYLLDLVTQLEAGQTALAPATAQPLPTPNPVVAGVTTSADDQDREDAVQVLEDIVNVLVNAEEQIEDPDEEE